MPGRKKLHSALGYHLPSAEPRPRGDRASWYPWVCDGVLGKDVPKLLESVWWHEIDQNYIRKLYDSMPRRLDTVIDLDGRLSKY